jgi:hypothetical protein
MIGENWTQQTAQDATNALGTCRQETPLETPVRPEGARPGFNRYLFENLMSNVNEQIGYWNRKAERQVDLQVAQALRLRAEGLGYALRLLKAFEPEFRELVDCASRATTDGTIHR